MEKQRNSVEYLKISDIQLSERSIKENDSLLFEKMKKSIQVRGQLKNIVVCQTETGYECLEGSKICKALIELGFDEVLGMNIGILSNEQKNIVKIEISRDYFLTNYVFIGEMLKQISDTHKLEEICNYLPYDVRQAKKMISMTEFDWDAFEQNKQIEGQISMFDIIEEEPLQEWQEAVLEMQIEQTLEVEPIVEQLSVEEAKQDVLIVDFVLPTDLDKITQEPVKEEKIIPISDLFFELNGSVKETKLPEVAPFDIAEKERELDILFDIPQIEEQEDSISAFKLIDNILWIYEDAEQIVNACQILSKAYLTTKYPDTKIVDEKMNLEEIQDNVGIKDITFISEWKVPYRITPDKIIKKLKDIYEL